MRDYSQVPNFLSNRLDTTADSRTGLSSQLGLTQAVSHDSNVGMAEFDCLSRPNNDTTIAATYNNEITEASALTLSEEVPSASSEYSSDYRSTASKSPSARFQNGGERAGSDLVPFQWQHAAEQTHSDALVYAGEQEKTFEYNVPAPLLSPFPPESQAGDDLQRLLGFYENRSQSPWASPSSDPPIRPIEGLVPRLEDTQLSNDSLRFVEGDTFHSQHLEGGLIDMAEHDRSRDPDQNKSRTPNSPTQRLLTYPTQETNTVGASPHIDRNKNVQNNAGRTDDIFADTDNKSIHNLGEVTRGEPLINNDCFHQESVAPSIVSSDFYTQDEDEGGSQVIP